MTEVRMVYKTLSYKPASTRAPLQINGNNLNAASGMT